MNMQIDNTVPEAEPGVALRYTQENHIRNYEPRHFYDNLTKFPHVVEKSTSLWGSQECRDYLVNLLSQTDRIGRQGFPFGAFRAIFDLLELHDYRFPEYRPPQDPWFGS